MSRRHYLAATVSLTLACLQLAPARALPARQETRPTPPAAPAPQTPSPANPHDDEVVRITTNLVQVDVSVTDGDGRQVTDLRAEDFEILEDGKAREITNFAYVRAGGPAPTTPARPADRDKNAKAPRPPAPPVTSLRPEQVRRTVALVLDDLTMSFEDVHFARGALKKFVEEQMQPGDLVAILRTSANAGALQQFTSDKRLLLAAIERLRWQPLTSGGTSAVAPIDMRAESPFETAAPTGRDPGDPRTLRSSRAEETRDSRRSVREQHQLQWASATLLALNQIVQGLRELPGRKAVVFVSDGIPLKIGEELSTPLMENMRRVVEHANRSSVVFYTVDARGPQDLLLSAADQLTDSLGRVTRPERLMNFQTGPLAARRSQFFDGQDGLIHLAQQTGGFNIRNSNDLTGAVARAVEDQSGYYLLGYRPDEGTFDRKTGTPNFNKLTVKVRGRGGLRVRARKGFYAVPEERLTPEELSPADRLRRALVSPFTSADVSVSLTSLFGNEEAAGSFVRSILHFDVRDLTFEPQPDGRMRASVEVLAVLVDGNGQAVDQLAGTHTFSVVPKTFERLQREGMDYMLNVPVKRPGGYQLRVAVRDTASGRVGTAGRFVDVPDLKDERLALSGLVISGSAEGATAAADAAEVESGPAVRRLRRGMMLDYGLVIYNARLERTGRPKLSTQVFLFRDGKQVYEGSPAPVAASGQSDLKRVAVGGRLQLGTSTEPGNYALMVVVTDAARGKPAVVSQWIDFEVVK